MTNMLFFFIATIYIWWTHSFFSSRGYNQAYFNFLTAMDNMTLNNTWDNITKNFTNTSEEKLNQNEVPSDIYREVFFCISAFITLTGNSLVLFTIYKSHTLHKCSYYFIANLAVGDLTSCLVVLIFNLPTAFLHRWIFGDFLCSFSGFLLQMLAFQTM